MNLFLEALKHVPLVAIGLLPIMNPLSTVPLFLALTRRMSQQHKRQQALRASLYAFAVLAAFLFLGNGIIALFGISLPGIRVAGGLIILVLAFRMLFSGTGEADSVEAGPSEIKQADLDFSFSPLAMPSLAGPGSIAVVMGYGSQIPEQHVALGYAVVLTGILITALIAYAALVGANWVSKFLGEHGIQAVTKIMGFLLTCVAVQFIASGVRQFVTSFS
ncbi:MAG: multiple drug resistance protein MarC [Xanthobacteraceae bacterium]|jgi:multiple antibiotic resistance protein|nr:multiple drug resistance protein MarC [Xanthobacteraceae bacterium]MDF2813464.1 multiple drug resistance protein MarC [Microvirga sp.]